MECGIHAYTNTEYSIPRICEQSVNFGRYIIKEDRKSPPFGGLFVGISEVLCQCEQLLAGVAGGVVEHGVEQGVEHLAHGGAAKAQLGD